MSRATPNTDVKLLPGAGGATPNAGVPAVPAQAAAPAQVSPSGMPARQLQDLPKDELDLLAMEHGLDPTVYKARQQLVAAVHERRQMVAAMDRDSLLDVVIWGRRPVPFNASKEQLALEIVQIRKMRFDGLTQKGLVALARLRGVELRGDEDVPALIKRLKKQEGFFARLNRKRRSWLGSVVSNILGEKDDAHDYQFLPPDQHGGATANTAGPGGAAVTPRGPTIKEDIEDQGLFGGLAGRIKKSADSYLNQKLDEIEARIDRKLDEIDRRLGEWRDKEVANRIRILKITLWASVIVAAVSLIYSYVRVYIVGK